MNRKDAVAVAVRITHGYIRNKNIIRDESSQNLMLPTMNGYEQEYETNYEWI